MYRYNNEVARNVLVTTPFMDGSSSDEGGDDDASSSHSCELDLEILGETTNTMRQQRASTKIGKLSKAAPQPSKLVNNYQITVAPIRASQRLSFTSEDDLDVAKFAVDLSNPNLTQLYDSLLEMAHSNSNTQTQSNPSSKENAIFSRMANSNGTQLLIDTQNS